MLALATALPFIMALPNPVPEVRGPGVSGPCRPIAARGRELDRTLRSGVFRIRYSTHGKNAVTNSGDVNRNGIPDVVDDLSRQLDVAYDYYAHVLGLHPPLAQPRYRRASTIDVLVRNLGRNNGLSFDEVVREVGEAHCKLLIEVDSRLRFDRNPTPAHELFHLFQYSYAMFKAPWYLEGMARWIEEAFAKPKNASSTKIAGAPLRCENILNRRYSASLFWRSMASRAEAQRSDSRSRRLPKGNYINGHPVAANSHFSGVIARPVLENLQKLSLQLSGVALPTFDWPEDVQKSHRFDQQMCSVIETVDVE